MRVKKTSLWSIFSLETTCTDELNLWEKSSQFCCICWPPRMKLCTNLRALFRNMCCNDCGHLGFKTMWTSWYSSDTAFVAKISEKGIYIGKWMRRYNRDKRVQTVPSTHYRTRILREGLYARERSLFRSFFPVMKRYPFFSAIETRPSVKSRRFSERWLFSYTYLFADVQGSSCLR